MENGITKLFSSFAGVQKLTAELKKERESARLYLSSLHGSSKSLLINELWKEHKQILALYPDAKSVNEAKVELDILELGDVVLVIDKFDAENVQEKITHLSQRKKFILISTYEIFRLRVPSRDAIEKSTTVIETGGDLSYDEIIEYLSMLNYDRDKYVDSPGEFAVRGSIIDFWSYSENHPVRAEFDGDFLESIRYFDCDSQRSLNRVEKATLAAKIESGETKNGDALFEYLDDPIVLIDKVEAEAFFDSDNEEITDEPEIPDDLDEELIEEFFDTPAEAADEEEEGELPRLEVNELDEILSNKGKWIIEDTFSASGKRIEMNLFPAPEINSNFEILFNQVNAYARSGYQIIITAENKMQAKRLIDLLSEFRREFENWIEEKILRVDVLPLNKGFVEKKNKVLLLTDYQIFNKPYRQKITSKYKTKKSRIKEFASIRRGDYVVHENFGIGMYAGLETIKIGMTEQECIKIQYAEGGVVYVNLNYLGLVKKFSSKDNAAPRLTVLGSKEWKNTKKKVKSKIKDSARELIKLYAERKASKGIAFGKDTIWQRELEASFFYEDTPDQAKVTEEVKEDMESPNPMDRLVCGDVGFGKTEIAVRAAFKAVNDGKQVGVLVPTTILAEQHYNTFVDRLSQFPVKVAALSRFQSKKEQTKIIDELSKGLIDIVIGTHRLISKDIKFKDLGLLIIDEEHRFGVMAKEKLRRMRVNVDTLTLTATPIPRTLNLSLLGARDLSIITTPPLNRQPIYTKVEKFDIHKIRQYVLDEIKRSGQVYFIHDRVHSIEKIAGYIQRHIPEINIAIAHGQMKPAQLEKVIHDFMHGKYHMLISTKIIESGIDIPNVNTIIINRADRFGLAELHQLRGRVGRSAKQAYAYMVVPSLKTITKKAIKRLQAIEEYTDLGSGFNLSMRDLEIRGAGNLLGTEQSGAIDSVGFDLYLKMLDEAVEELKREEFGGVFEDLPKIEARSEPRIDTYFRIGIPEDYMPDQADRLGFYSSLFSILRIEEIPDIVDEMRDKFGKPPRIVERLVMIAEMRFYASYALFEKVLIDKNRISIGLPKADNEEFYNNNFAGIMKYILAKYPKDIQFKQDRQSMSLEIRNRFKTAEAAIEFVANFSKEIEKLMNGK